MNVSPTPNVLADAESATATFLRAQLEDVDVRANLSTWDGTTTVVHVHRVGGTRDRFVDRARLAVDVHAPDRDTAFGIANDARGWLLAWPALGGSCRGAEEELGPTELPTTNELPIVAMTWVVSI